MLSRLYPALAACASVFEVRWVSLDFLQPWVPIDTLVLSCRDCLACRRKLTISENLVASGIAVVGATVVTHPIDVVKVQLQLSAKDAQAPRRRRDLGSWRPCELERFCLLWLP